MFDHFLFIIECISRYSTKKVWIVKKKLLNKPDWSHEKLKKICNKKVARNAKHFEKGLHEKLIHSEILHNF